MSEITLIDVDEIPGETPGRPTTYLPKLQEFLASGRPHQEVIFSGRKPKTVYYGLMAVARRHGLSVRVVVRRDRVFLLRKDS